MTKFERVLSDACCMDILAKIDGFSATSDGEVYVGSGDDVWFQLAEFAEQVEKATIAALKKRLAEQEPVMYARTYNGEIDWDEACVTGDDDGLLLDGLTHVNDDGDIEVEEGYEVIPLYAHPMPCVSNASDKTACASENGESETQANSQGLLDSSNHVVDNNEMVADMYWINPDYPSYTSILDAFDPVQSAVEVEIGDQFEVSRAKTLPDLTIEVAELEENGDVKDFKVLSGDHIPNIGQMVTPLAQRKIQTLLDKGEFREMKGATVLVDDLGHAAIVNRGGAFYWVDNEGLAREFDAAPKYTGDKQ